MKNIQLPLLKELDLSDTEALASRPKPYDLPLDVNQTGEQQAKTFCFLGYEQGREWLNAPRSRPLSYLRLQFKCSVMDVIERSDLNSPSVPETAAGIIELLELYNVGLDQALEEFVLLATALPQVGM